MINTGAGGLEWLLILGFVGVIAIGYYFLVVVASREPKDRDNWDDTPQ